MGAPRTSTLLLGLGAALALGVLVLSLAIGSGPGSGALSFGTAEVAAGASPADATGRRSDSDSGGEGAKRRAAGPTTPAQPPWTDLAGGGYGDGPVGGADALDSRGARIGVAAESDAEPEAPALLVRGRVRAVGSGSAGSGSAGSGSAASAAGSALANGSLRATVRLDLADRHAEADTDAHGDFELAWRFGTRADVLVEAPGHLALRRPAVDLNELLEFRLEPAAHLVFEGPSSLPGEGRMELWRQQVSDGRRWLAVDVERTGPGRFEAVDLPAGDYAYQGQFGGLHVPFREGLRLEGGERRVERIEPVPGATVAVQVRDEHGRPVADAAVRALPQRGSRPETARDALLVEGVVDEAGRVRFHGLVPGTWRITATAPFGAERGRDVKAPADGSTVDLEITVPAPLVVRGRVLDPDGNPAGGVRVRSGSPDRIGSVLAAEGDDIGAVSASDGTFELADLPQGDRWPLLAEPPAARRDDWGALYTSTGSLRASASQELVLRLPRAAPLIGRVLRANGEPLAGAEVRVLRSSSVRDAPYHTAGDAVTGADGRFEIAAFAEGPAELRVSAAQHRPVQLRFEHRAGVEHPDIGLEPAISLVATVRTREGDAVPGLFVRARAVDAAGGRGRNSGSDTTDAFGRARFDTLPVGPHRMELWSSEWELVAPVEFDAPALAPVEIVVAPMRGPERAVLVGHVLERESNAPPDNLSLDGPRGGTPIQEGATFRWSGLAPRPTPLSLRAPGLRALDLGTVLLEPGMEHDIGTVLMERGVVVEIEVVDTKGVAISGAAVRLQPLDPDKQGPSPAAPTLSVPAVGGRYRTDQAAPGRWRLRVDHQWHSSHSRGLRLPVDGPVRVVLGDRTP
ncbi:MAG: hypothetical protein GC161_15935 [Planctomycetaceae bacterium]|nr:hypothetical protein [Planctomycetaceae bacterium]